MSSIRIHFSPVDCTFSARDVGYLLEKHPDRLFEKEISEASRFTAVFESANDAGVQLLLRAITDPLTLARGGSTISSYVNDHPWSAGSIFWQGFSKSFRSALGGRTRGSIPVDTLWGVVVEIPAIFQRVPRAKAFFEPLGYTVTESPVLETSIWTLRLIHQGITVQNLFQHLYVLGMALDSRRHYSVQTDATAEKLLAEAGSWLPAHPEYKAIAAGFAGHVWGAVKAAVEAVEAQQPTEEEGADLPIMREAAIEQRVPLSRQRLEAIVAEVKKRVPILDPGQPPLILEVGCGVGRLVEALAAEGYCVLGIEQSAKAAMKAASWIRRNKVPRAGIEVHSALYALPQAIYLNPRGIPVVDRAVGKRKEGDPERTYVRPECIVATEVIEHCWPADVDLFLASIFSNTPNVVILTTPNKDFNAVFGMTPDQVRDPDHKFEWGVAQAMQEVMRRTPLWYTSEAAASTGARLAVYSMVTAGVGPTAKAWMEAEGAAWVSDERAPPSNVQPTTMLTLFHSEPLASACKVKPTWPSPAASSLFSPAGVPEFHIPWEQREGALFMLRSAAPLKMLPYLPPTMSPVDTTPTGPLETVEAALEYYAARGVDDVVVQEKHMGSRAIAYFAPSGEAVLYTRSGRLFSPEVANLILPALRAGIDALGLTWALIDGELLPWSAKAGQLVAREFEPAGAALLADSRFTNNLRGRQQADAYLQVLRHFCAVGDPVRYAPFAVLASNNPAYSFGAPHMDQMDACFRMAQADLSGRIIETSCLHCSTQVTSGASPFFKVLVYGGAEGVVVKPASGMAATSAEGLLIQPGVKVRDPDYLRIIYGPQYMQDEHMARLRERGTKRKRRLAWQEHALGLGSLRALQANRGNVNAQVHRGVFGVLALENEGMDPRL